MKTSFMEYIRIIIATVVLATTFSACAYTNIDSNQANSVIITNIANWHHPVKKVFTQHKVKLYKVVLTQHKQYPIFYVSFPYDPQSSQTSNYFNQLYAEILSANGWLSYTLLDKQDRLRIEVNWDKRKKVMTTNFVPLK